MALGKWLTNTKNLNAINAQGSMTDREWEHHQKYVDDHVVGPPKASKRCTVKQLESWDMVGIYKKS